MRRTIRVDIDNILGLIACAEMYGHNNDVAMDAFASFLGRKLSEREILRFANSYLTPGSRKEGYGQEDRDAVLERLTDFKARYILAAPSSDAASPARASSPS